MEQAVEILMNRYNELRDLEQVARNRGRESGAREWQAAAFEVGQLANQLRNLSKY